MGLEYQDRQPESIQDRKRIAALDDILDGLKLKGVIEAVTMISVTELRAGTNFLLDSQPYQVVKYEHSKIGRGTANIKVKVKNLQSGVVLEKTFISGAKVEPVEVERKKRQFLYQDEVSTPPGCPRYDTSGK